MTGENHPFLFAVYWGKIYFVHVTSLPVRIQRPLTVQWSVVPACFFCEGEKLALEKKAGKGSVPNQLVDWQGNMTICQTTVQMSTPLNVPPPRLRKGLHPRNLTARYQQLAMVFSFSLHVPNPSFWGPLCSRFPWLVFFPIAACQGNPKPSFLGFFSPIYWWPKTFHFSMGCWGPSSWTTQKKTGSWVNSFQASIDSGGRRS